MSNVTRDLGHPSQPVCYFHDCPLWENSCCWKSRIKTVQNKILTKDVVDHWVNIQQSAKETRSHSDRVEIKTNSPVHREANEASFLTDVSHFPATTYHNKPGSSTERSSPLTSSRNILSALYYPPPITNSPHLPNLHLFQNDLRTTPRLALLPSSLTSWASTVPQGGWPTRLRVLISHPVDMWAPSQTYPKASWAHTAAFSSLARPVCLSFLYPSQQFTWKL